MIAMYILKLYDLDWGLLYDTLYYHSKENAENKAREWMRKYLSRHPPGETPQEYGCISWEEVIENCVRNGGSEDIFSLHGAAFED